MLSSINCRAKTDVGLVRGVNEDSYLVLEPKNLYAVFDGMGGHAAGNIASYIAANLIDKMYSNHSNYDELAQINQQLIGSTAQNLGCALQIANLGLYNLAYKYPNVRGMGTTAVACIVEHNQIHIAHVGDSRLYRFRNNTLEQLTTDHSWVNEMIEDKEIKKEDAKHFKKKNVLTRVLGVRPSVKVDIKTELVEKGDIYLLCSDGMTTSTEDSEIQKLLRSLGGDIDPAASKLVELANANGGDDNVTVVVMKVQSQPESVENTKSIGQLYTLSEPDEATSQKEEKLARKLLKSIDMSIFKKEKNGGGLSISRKNAILLLTFLLLLFTAFFFRDTIVKTFVANIKRSSSSDINADEEPKTRNEAIEQLKELIPESETLRIKKPSGG